MSSIDDAAHLDELAPSIPTALHDTRDNDTRTGTIVQRSAVPRGGEGYRVCQCNLEGNNGAYESTVGLPQWGQKAMGAGAGSDEIRNPAVVRAWGLSGLLGMHGRLALSRPFSFRHIS